MIEITVIAISSRVCFASNQNLYGDVLKVSISGSNYNITYLVGYWINNDYKTEWFNDFELRKAPEANLTKIGFK